MILDYTNPDSVGKAKRLVASTLRGIRDNMRRGAARYTRSTPHTGQAISLQIGVELISDDGSGLDVRFAANDDGETWFATGDVQYDTKHGAACGACTLNPNDDDEALTAMADDMVADVVDQLTEQAS